MPHHHKRHHVQTHHSQITTHRSHSSPVAVHVAPYPPFHLANLPLSPWEAFGGYTFVGLFLVGGLVRLTRSLHEFASSVQRDRERWAAARDMRKRAEAEEHVAESVARMLGARERVARASTSMYGANVDLCGAQVRSLESQRFLESVISGNALPSVTALPFLLSSASPSSGGGSADQSDITRAALHAVIENGSDLSVPAVQQAWKEWEQRIRQEHSSQTACAIIDAARTLLQEAN